MDAIVIDASRSMLEQAQRPNLTNWRSNPTELGKILRFSEDQPSHPGNPSESEGVLSAH